MDVKNKNKSKKIGFVIITAITIYLFYCIRKNEEELKNNKFNSIHTKEFQIEDDINLSNSKVLNIKVCVDDIKKNIMKIENDKMENIKRIHKKDEVELWNLETFFLTFFSVILVLFYFSENKKCKNNEYQKDNEKYDDCLIDSEREFLINKEANTN